jgi:type I restriction enzyme R subunit
MITEADTCRKYVLPKLIEAGWDEEPHSFTEQKTFTDKDNYVLLDPWVVQTPERYGRRCSLSIARRRAGTIIVNSCLQSLLLTTMQCRV